MERIHLLLRINHEIICPCCCYRPVQRRGLRGASDAANLQPAGKRTFAVNSTLVSGPHEAVLFDAQFSVKDGEKLVEMIKKNGKPLSRIVITSGDPDFYFGLEPLVKAFPQAEVVATPEVVRHIAATKAAKLAYWGPQMKDGAPTQVYVPQALKANSFTIDGEKVTIMQPHDYAAFVWIRANKTILGGTGVAWGMHLWTADTQTPASRQQWRNTLDQMIALHPQRVIPGHYLGTPPEETAQCALQKLISSSSSRR